MTSASRNQSGSSFLRRPNPGSSSPHGSTARCLDSVTECGESAWRHQTVSPEYWEAWDASHSHLFYRGHLLRSLVIPNKSRSAYRLGVPVAFWIVSSPPHAWEQLDLILPACLPSSPLPLISSSKVLACLYSPRSLVTLESLPLLSLMKECLIRYKRILRYRRQNLTRRWRNLFSFPLLSHPFFKRAKIAIS